MIPDYHTLLFITFVTQPYSRLFNFNSLAIQQYLFITYIKLNARASLIIILELDFSYLYLLVYLLMSLWYDRHLVKTSIVFLFFLLSFHQEIFIQVIYYLVQDFSSFLTEQLVKYVRASTLPWLIFLQFIVLSQFPTLSRDLQTFHHTLCSKNHL